MLFKRCLMHYHRGVDTVSKGDFIARRNQRKKIIKVWRKEFINEYML